MTLHRAQAALVEAARDYPDCWKRFDFLRHDVQARGVRWSSWCWAPLAAAYAVASGGETLPLELAGDVSRLGALAAWRVTQGIYRLDETLLDELWQSDVDGSLPVETLLHLPEWCVYVETPGRTFGGRPLHGFWAHLEEDSHEGGVGAPRVELRFVLDTDEGLIGLPLHLGRGRGTLVEAIAGAVDEMLANAATAISSPEAQLLAGHVDVLHRALGELRPLVSVVLYLCTAAAEELRTADGRSPSHPAPRPGRRGEAPRYYPPTRAALYTPGVRLGAALRAARAREASAAGVVGTGHSPMGHVRRAHWHTYVLGPRDGERRREVRWLPPILVRLEPDAVAPVIRPVKGER